MDEEALRAMMPMSFGKAAKPRPGAAPRAAPEASSSSSAAPLQGIAWDSPTAAAARSAPAVRGPMRPASGPQKRPAAASDDDDDESDDGLTPAERAANREAERRAAEQGGASDDDSDGSVDLGPEPQGDDELGLPVAQCVELKDHTKVSGRREAAAAAMAWAWNMLPPFDGFQADSRGVGASHAACCSSKGQRTRARALARASRIASHPD
jgi:hypothetical protein